MVLRMKCDFTPHMVRLKEGKSEVNHEKDPI